MRRLIPAPAVIVVAVSLLAQTSPPSGKPDGHPDSSCSVSGRVVTATDGSPLKSARLTLVPEHDGQKTQLYAATTDSDGRFLLKDLVPGRYHFAASHAGFVTQSYKAKGTDDGAVLSLRPGERVSDVLFRMMVSGVVTGRVTNEDGEPMVRAQIVALQRPSEEELEDEGPSASRKWRLQAVSSAQTDDRGQYRIFGLKPGEYYLKAADSSEPDRNTLVDESFWIRDILGSEYAPAYYPGVAPATQAQVVCVLAGDEVQADILMQRAKTVEIAGHVIGRDGPAKNTWVNLKLAADDYGIDRQTTTDETGSFELKGIPPGSYVISVYQRDEGNSVYEPRGQQRVEVSGENIDSVTILVGGGTSVQGRVTVEGGSSPKLDRIGIVLDRVDDDEQLGAHGRVKKDGTFEIKSVGDGNYAISIWGPENNWYLKSVRLGQDDILEKGLQLEKGGSGRTIEVVVSSATAQLDGSVSDDDSAVAGAHVRVVPEPETLYNRSRARSARADQTGHFSLSGLAPGTYRVLAKYGASTGDGALRSEPQIVTLSERDHKTLQLTMAKSKAE
jgi:protocatechuate 3,4-dioxygenase beta subunit